MDPVIGIPLALLFVLAVVYGLYVGAAGRGVGASLGRLVRRLRK